MYIHMSWLLVCVRVCCRVERFARICSSNCFYCKLSSSCCCFYWWHIANPSGMQCNFLPTKYASKTLNAARTFRCLCICVVGVCVCVLVVECKVQCTKLPEASSPLHRIGHLIASKRICPAATLFVAIAFALQFTATLVQIKYCT